MRNFLVARRKQLVVTLVVLVALALFLLPTALSHAQTVTSSRGVHQQTAQVSNNVSSNDHGGGNGGHDGGGHGGGHDGGNDR